MEVLQLWPVPVLYWLKAAVIQGYRTYTSSKMLMIKVSWLPSLGNPILLWETEHLQFLHPKLPVDLIQFRSNLFIISLTDRWRQAFYKTLINSANRIPWSVRAAAEPTQSLLHYKAHVWQGWKWPAVKHTPCGVKQSVWSQHHKSSQPHVNGNYSRCRLQQMMRSLGHKKIGHLHLVFY